MKYTQTIIFDTEEEKENFKKNIIKNRKELVKSDIQEIEEVTL